MFRVYGCVFGSISLFFGLHVYTYAFKSKFHCGSALGLGASGHPYYCTLPVYVPDVNEALALWRQNTQKKNCTIRMLSRLLEGGYQYDGSHTDKQTTNERQTCTKPFYTHTPLQNNIHVSKVHCGGAFELGLFQSTLLLRTILI